jgi:hypothetical protein
MGQSFGRVSVQGAGGMGGAVAVITSGMHSIYEQCTLSSLTHPLQDHIYSRVSKGLSRTNEAERA